MNVNMQVRPNLYKIELFKNRTNTPRSFGISNLWHKEAKTNILRSFRGCAFCLSQHTCVRMSSLPKITGGCVWLRKGKKDKKRDSEITREQSIYSANDLFIPWREEDGHLQVICAEQWAALAPEGNCWSWDLLSENALKAQALPEDWGIRISLKCTAASSSTMVTREGGSVATLYIRNYLQVNRSYWLGWPD